MELGALQRRLLKILHLLPLLPHPKYRSSFRQIVFQGFAKTRWVLLVVTLALEAKEQPPAVLFEQVVEADLLVQEL